MQELLDMAEALEAASVGAAWTGEVGGLAKALGVTAPTARASIPPTFALALHQALSRRILRHLEGEYWCTEAQGCLELTPKHLKPTVRIVGLHGADDAGPSFAAVFGELLMERPTHLLCPTAQGGSWATADYHALAARLARAPDLPLFLVGFSAGANAALELREHLRPVGAVAIASAPSLVQSRALGIPTLYVHGTDDALFSLAELEETLEPRTLEDWPDPLAELQAVEGYGHGYPYRVVAHHVLPFVDKLAPRERPPTKAQGDSVR